MQAFTKGQRVTVERQYPTPAVMVMAAGEIRTVQSISSTLLVLDDGSHWNADGSPLEGYLGDLPARVRAEEAGDVDAIDTRACIERIRATGAAIWRKVPVGILRSVVVAIEAAERACAGYRS